MFIQNHAFLRKVKEDLAAIFMQILSVFHQMDIEPVRWRSWVSFVGLTEDLKRVERYEWIREGENEWLSPPSRCDYDLILLKTESGGRGCWVNPSISSKYVMKKPTEVARTLFMSVEYRHPSLAAASKVFLDIGREYFFVGNELLSSTFVKRWLDYNVGKHVPFDDDYWLEFIDFNELKTVRLNSRQYVQIISVDEYLIVDVNTLEESE